jgi:Flp pilus assembly pilin Flp
MKLNQKQSGQGMTEYILIVALIAVAVIGAVKIFGSKVNDGFNNAANQVSGNTSSSSASNAAGSAASGAANGAVNAVKSGL